MRIRLSLVLLFLPAVASAEIGDYPIRESDRPLVLVPGLAEFDLTAGFTKVPGAYDADARVAHTIAGGVTSSWDSTLVGRYGLFRDFEIHVRAPYTLALATKGSSTAISGSGRAALGVSWTPPETGTSADLALGGALLLPTTARSLRTDPAGLVHHDHLAVAASLDGKIRVADDAAAHGGGSIVFPFANEDDRTNDRNPPASFSIGAGSTFQLSDRVWTDASAAFSRTNRDRVAGGIVPRSDQFLVDFEPSIGIAPTRWYDLRLSASIPLAGKNTSQAFALRLGARARF